MASTSNRSRKAPPSRSCPRRRFGYLTLLRVAFRYYPKRAILGATLMITQSFLYNAIFFTYALVLTKFYHVSNNDVPLYGLAFAVGNLAGPLILGHLFDTIGRKKMISGTYLISGVMLAFSAWLFSSRLLDAASQLPSGSSCSSSHPRERVRHT